MKKVKIHLEMDDIILHKWFHENHMVLSPGKCYYLVIGDTEPSHKVILNNNKRMEECQCRMMPANLEWAKRTFNVLALLTKNYNFFGTLLLGILLVFPFY